MRFDMPGLDISQALLELREFGHVFSVIPLPLFRRSAERALMAGYGRPVAGGPEFWLPHLRNLSVCLLTLARKCHNASLDGLSDKVRYHRTVEELRRCVRAVAV